ncbi:MAG: MFS transporter [Chloroflexi bacterium]|nr:MAG: MFS transporter [Chloroflexota bacterium]
MGAWRDRVALLARGLRCGRPPRPVDQTARNENPRGSPIRSRLRLPQPQPGRPRAHLLLIAVPVLVLGRLHQGPAAVGYVWGAVGAAGLVSTLITGRLKTRGRERRLMAGSIVAVALAMAVMPFATSVLVVAAALVAVAIVETPFDIAFLTLRQRRTDPARFGRVFAVSMSLNVVGTPVGLALAGPLIAWSLNGALWFAVAATLIGAVFPLLVIPARDES